MTLVEIAQFVRVDDIGQYVLTIILVSDFHRAQRTKQWY